MREAPPKALIELVERLRVAGGSKVRRMHGRVKRLARGLPAFQSVWVDALAQARILTPYQAAEINAGRGDALRVGLFAVDRPLPSPGYADYYAARQIDTGRRVRLAVARPRPGPDDGLANDLGSLAAKSEAIDSEHLAPIDQAGRDGERLWLAGPHADGQSAAEWMVHNGRFPPPAALEIARQVLAALVTLEKAGICHGDLAAWNLLITEAGRVVLPHPGVRGLLRPAEGYARADLPPEAYDYLAPERITEGTPPTVASDVFACGCLFWHLLTGRAPRPGGTALAKLRAAQAGEIPDVRSLAPHTPEPLAAAVTACVAREPQRRPDSMARLAAMLGPATHHGRLHLARCITRPGEQPSRWAASASAARHAKQTPVWVAAIAGCVLAAVGLTWTLQKTSPPLPTASIPARTTGPAARPQSEMPHPDPPPPEPASPPPQPAVDPAAPQGSPGALDPLPGQGVRGRPDQRRVVLVPPQGLVVDQEDARFENVDFLWQHAGDPRPPQAAVIELRASGAEFRGCSFQADEAAAAPPVAIRWVHPVDRGEARLALPSGRVRLADCVIRGLAAGVVCETAGAVAVEFDNVMHLAAGPLVVLDHAPAADEPVTVTLSGVTLRGAGPVLECRYHTLEGPPGRIRIEAGQCAFAIGPATGLLSFAGPSSPEPLLAGVEWTGDGSLISPEAAVALWQQPDGKVQVLDEAGVAIAGLVRSGVEFAGPPEAGPAAGRIVRWQAPLRSPDPPGANPDRLPSPR